MVPWPVALLTLFYGVIAALSAAMVTRILTGVSHQSVWWPIAWLALSAGAVCGLPLLTSWGRRLAIAVSSLLILATLAAAGVLVAAGRPGIGLLVTFSTGCHYLMIRYLQRPSVTTLFRQPAISGE